MNTQPPTEEQNAQNQSQTSSDVQLSQPYVAKKATECKEVLAARTVKSQGLTNTIQPHEARSGPNKGLVDGFGISNCFTTTSKDYCQEFRKIAENKLYIAVKRWSEIAVTVNEIVEAELPDTKQRFNLFEVAQTTTLKTALHILFDFDTKQPHLDEHTVLKECIKALLPNAHLNDPDKSPFNLILPGYETLWRVVLRCFLELTCRDHEHGAAWQEVLQKFLKNPNLAQLKDETVNDSGVSATFITDETLRLYPPTRRVYRDYKNADGTVRDVSADIESAHRDESAWGEDALKFRPKRWAKLPHDKFKDENFMPFSAFPFNCVAKRRFKMPDNPSDKIAHIGAPAGQNLLPPALTMITMLVGALTAEVDGTWKLSGDVDLESDQPLDTDRKAYNDIFFVRV